MIHGCDHQSVRHAINIRHAKPIKRWIWTVQMRPIFLAGYRDASVASA